MQGRQGLDVCTDRLESRLLTHLCESKAHCVCASLCCGCTQVMHTLLAWCRSGSRS